ncbi:MAG: type II toxin-antitoxin system prevent-host-death family antitoxin [Anaerolineales bacterium]|nr:type II toxin-antitoxin system prevent-host-death family antitoxin [Anaerolineales bacterium]
MAELQVGIRELRNHLSRYLREIKKGRSIVITERGKPIGRIIPKELPIEDRVEALMDAGILKWNGKKLEPTKPVITNQSPQLISDIILEMRE